MYDNFENLQNKCKRYKLKKRVKLSLQIAFIPALLLGYLLSQETTPKIKKTSEVQKIVVKNETKNETNTSKNTQSILTKQEKKKRVIKDVPYSLLIDSKYRVKKTKKITPIYKEESVAKNIQSVYVKKEDKTSVEILVKRLNSTNDMLKLYKQENKYSLAIKIAQNYYDSKQYAKSLLWAKKANLLNRDDSKAWILYAKSEYAQKNHKRAIKILRLYLTNSISIEAEELLLIWNQGK